MSDGDVETVLWQRVLLINNQLDDYQKIRKFAVLSDDFPEPIRSIAALRKIKIDRQAIEERYRKEIERIYSGGGQNRSIFEAIFLTGCRELTDIRGKVSSRRVSERQCAYNVRFFPSICRVNYGKPLTQ